MAVTMTFDVEYDDGSTAQVTADQRDMVVFERVEKRGVLTAMSEMQVTLYRFLAYQALKRQGLIDSAETRETWEARTVAAVWNMGGAADPGHPEASAGSSSTSPVRRRSASGSSRAARTGNPKT